MLALLDQAEGSRGLGGGGSGDGGRKVYGIDIDIREHNRAAIEDHPLSSYIELVEGSSVDQEIIFKIKEAVTKKGRSPASVMVCLDSNHTHRHVRDELLAYADLVTVGNYLVVFDTVIDDLPADLFEDRPWGYGNNPKTAVRDFLESRSDFEIDRFLENKLLLTAAPSGYLRRFK